MNKPVRAQRESILAVPSNINKTLVDRRREVLEEIIRKSEESAKISEEKKREELESKQKLRVEAIKEISSVLGGKSTSSKGSRGDPTS